MSVINSTAPLSTLTVQDASIYKVLVYLDDGTVSGDGNAVAVKLSNNAVVLSTSAHIFKNFRTFDTSRIKRVLLSNPDTGLTFEVGFNSVFLHPEWRGIADNQVGNLFDGGRDLAAIVIPAGIVVPGVEP